MQRRSAAPALLASALLLLPATASAKDLRNRFGVGFNSWFGELNALSIRYGVPTGDSTINLQLEGDFGFTNKDLAPIGATGIFGGGRILFGVVAEDNMNLYLGAGAGYVDYNGTGLVRVQPSASIDFFLFGLENLGFSSGFGLDMDVGDSTGISTTASVLGGLHYWF